MKAPNRDKTALTEKEVDAMFKAAEDNPLEYAILKTLYYSGMRQQELRSLDIDDVDFDRLQITIKHGKGDRYRVVTKDCAAAIKRWLQVRPKPKEGHEKALFISCYKQRIGSYYVWKVVKRNAAKVGVTKNVYPHKFRITMITRMAEAGSSPREIQAQSGHKDLETLIGYIQHTPDRIRESYERVFEKKEIFSSQPEIQKRNIIPQMSNEYYKKMAIKKYLDGEIDIDTLHSILANIENNDNNMKKRPNIDISYQ